MADWLSEMTAAVGANDAPTTVHHWLNTGHPLLNDAISGSYHGGMPSGRIVEMMGASSTGKTAIATQVMVAAQRSGGVAMFMDHERSFDHRLAESFGLDTSTRWVFKSPDTFEQSLAIVSRAATTIREKKLIAPEAPIVAVFDSLAAMVPKSKFEKGVEEYNMNDTTALARATSSSLPWLAVQTERQNFLALFLNQVRTKPGVSYGDPETSPGGAAMEFYSSVRIKLRRKKNSEGQGSDKEIVGQTITAETIKNKVHRPFAKAQWDMVFTDDGHARFDAIGSTLDWLVENKLLTKVGHRIEWDGKALYRKDIIERIYASGDPLPLYSLLPQWADDAAESKQKIDWSVKPLTA